MLTTLSVGSNGHFTLRVQNNSALGILNTFAWSPPPDLTISEVTRKTSTGTCQLMDGDIRCQGSLPPPRCTCETGPERAHHLSGHAREEHQRSRPPVAQNTLVVGVGFGSLHVQGLTPVPYIVPSAVGQVNPDVPDVQLAHR